MLAARFYAPRDVRLEDVEAPTAGRGEIVLRTLASNMCGTDLKAYLRGHPMLKPPMTMGHEFSGEVFQAGEGVTDFRRGERVVASDSSPCMKCSMCRLGSLNLCERTRTELVGFSLPGSYAEYVRVPERITSKNTYRFRGSVSPSEAACAEPLASAIHALDRVKLWDGMKAAIIGAGALGLLFLQLLKREGASVTVTNRSRGRLHLAERLGADNVVKVTDGNLAAKVRAVTDGVGADLVIEAVGRRETWESAFKATRNGGEVLLFGGCAAGTVASFDAEKLHYGEISVVGSFHHEPSSFKRAVKAIEAGEVKVKPLLTYRTSLRRIADAFELMESRKALKVTITP